MASSRRGAVTLVELLVLIIVIGVLAVLVSAWDQQTGHEDARRAQCENNERQIGLAAQLYQAEFNSFPGYWMPATATKPIGTTWPLTLSKYLERQDIWNAWTGVGSALPPAGSPFDALLGTDGLPE